MQAAANLVQARRLAEGEILSPVWMVRTPSKKRVNLILIDDGKAVEEFLISIGLKERKW